MDDREYSLWVEKNAKEPEVMGGSFSDVVKSWQHRSGNKYYTFPS